MKKQMRGLGFYVIVIGIIMLALYMSTSFNPSNAGAYNYSQFVKDLEAGNVTSADLYPEENTTSGKVMVKLKNNTHTFTVTDLDSVANLLQAKNGICCLRA